MSQLVAVGTVAFDAIETPFGKTDKILGGAATYIGLAASHLNVDVALVAIIGDDFPQSFLDTFESRNINIDGVEIVSGGKSFFWSGRYHHDMNSRDTLATELNVLTQFEPKVPSDYKEADVLLLGNLNPEAQLAAISQMNNPKFIIMDTMNYWMNTSMAALKEVIARVDAITINDEEARQLSGEYSLVKAANKIQTMGPKFVIIKKGEHGALLFHREQVFFAPALPLEEVFDPTGAGDSFAGGFAGYLAKTEDFSFENLKSAIVYGTALASFCVEAFGTERLLEINNMDIQRRLSMLKSLMQFDIEIH
ncbi:MAG: PfkB family carbohydrate kinase [Bacteroidetes bacterium]|jgi:sugar/nucleoside kinase (ribokinase family)|nr:PfkB family carbohydrate kinase [Bacteroidota bacterium]MDA0879754.1 PfkB family carbohydrate kinase [Bacteroidota bacterium]MDA1115742.1 PfkB family carbohydrate kinase [Bacteroidota bacterium]